MPNANQTEVSERDAIKSDINRAELIERIARATPKDGSITVLPGLSFHRVSAPTPPRINLSEPALGIIAQGSKEILLGTTRYRYDPAHYFLITLELPGISHVIDASPQKPYLSLSLSLDPILVGSVLVEAGHVVPQHPIPAPALAVDRLNVDVLDAVVRLARLVDSPHEARILAPLVTREIMYRLVMGEHSARLRHLVRVGATPSRILMVIERLRTDFDKPLRIETLARESGMSVSSLHHHFKAVTAMSPVQFQKQLRLHAARRVMLSEDIDVAGAGYRVGYDDPAYFNREYKSVFGVPPLRDIQRLREAAWDEADAAGAGRTPPADRRWLSDNEFGL